MNVENNKPLSAEELPGKWRYSINYGPDGEQDYAMVYDGSGYLVGNLRTHHAMAMVHAVNDGYAAAQVQQAATVGDRWNEAIEAAQQALFKEFGGDWEDEDVHNMREVVRALKRPAAQPQTREGGDVQPKSYYRTHPGNESPAAKFAREVRGICRKHGFEDGPFLEEVAHLFTTRQATQPAPSVLREALEFCLNVLNMVPDNFQGQFLETPDFKDGKEDIDIKTYTIRGHQYLSGEWLRPFIYDVGKAQTMAMSALATTAPVDEGDMK